MPRCQQFQTAGPPSPPPSGTSLNSFRTIRSDRRGRPLLPQGAPGRAAEERYDVALVFCAKAVDVAPRHLAARLLIAKIYDKGLDDLEAAVAAYRKVIALAGYDGANPHCLAAREALDALVHRAEIAASPAARPSRLELSAPPASRG